MYQKKREIKRTVFRGVVLWPEELQALPPWGWCDRCGAEVYTPGDALCRRCKKEFTGGIENEQSLFEMQPGGRSRCLRK